MADLRTTYTGFIAGADLMLADGDLAADAGLSTALILSLFSDRRAAADDALPDGTADRRGWWGDLAPLAEGYQLGSRLWLLAREKQVPVVLERARYYAEEALAWLVTSGVASRVSVVASVPRTGILGLAITIERPAQGAATWHYQWDALSRELT